MMEICKLVKQNNYEEVQVFPTKEFVLVVLVSSTNYFEEKFNEPETFSSKLCSTHETKSQISFGGHHKYDVLTAGGKPIATNVI